MKRALHIKIPAWNSTRTFGDQTKLKVKLQWLNIVNLADVTKAKIFKLADETEKMSMKTLECSMKKIY